MSENIVPMNICNHYCEHLTGFDYDNNFSLLCTCCSTVFYPKCNYSLDKFRTTMKPTNHDKKIFNITKLDDESYFYELKVDLNGNSDGE